MQITQQNGYYGAFGGCFLPEILMAPIQDLQAAWKQLQTDASFQIELTQILCQYAGRPTPLTRVSNFSASINGPQIFLKREDLLHTGAHKINNALGQCLIAKHLGKQRVIAETGAGQHGVATAAACARLGLDCVVYMGAKDMYRQAPNVARMQLMGAQVIAVNSGSQTLKDAVNEALRDWSESFSTSFYCLGSALGPHPYPEMVAHFQAVIGTETLQQCHELQIKPDMIVACVGGGSNAIGMFSAFIPDATVRLIGVEAGGNGCQLGEHAARFKTLTPGVLHGCHTYVLQNQEGQIAETASISAGLDYPAVGPQHAYLHAIQRAQYVSVQDEQAVQAMKLLARTEGILCALESAHALAYLCEVAHNLPKQMRVIVNLSGRGDKDLAQINPS